MIVRGFCSGLILKKLHFRGKRKKKNEATPIKQNRSTSWVLFWLKIFDEHFHPFYMGVPPGMYLAPFRLQSGLKEEEDQLAIHFS